MKYRIIDVETTGFDPEQDSVVEVACVELDPQGRGSRIVGTFERMVNPGQAIPATASAVHHIVDSDVFGAPSLDAVLTQMSAQFPQQHGINVAHNAGFDAPFLGDDPKTWLCTYRLASHLWPEAPGHGNQVLRYWLNLDVPQAKGLAAHRALVDCYVTAQLLLAALDKAEQVWGTKEPGEMVRRCWEPILQRTCRFGKHAGKPWAEVPTDYLRWMLRQGEAAWNTDIYYTACHHYQNR